MKKILFVISMLLFGMGQGLASYATTQGVVIDESESNMGIVKISYLGESKKALKVLIVKGQQRYNYQLNAEGRMESYPLQMGDGAYMVGILENVKDNTYAFIENKRVEVKMNSSDSVFLASIQEIKWDTQSEAVKKSLQLIGLETSSDKRFDVVYNYLVKNLSYDYAKIPTLKSGYIPDVDQTLSIKKGICYDYSALLAAMIRSQGIPTKLVKGYTKNTDVFHAWNEVKIKDEWWLIDTTIDSISLKKKIQVKQLKDATDYKKVSEY